MSVRRWQKARGKVLPENSVGRYRHSHLILINFNLFSSQIVYTGLYWSVGISLVEIVWGNHSGTYNV